VLIVATALGAYAVVSSRGEWSPWSSLTAARTTSTAPPAREMTLGVPTGGEVALAGARTLVSSGDLHGALSALERVRPTDPQRGEADRLRADVQRQLIRSVSDGLPAPAAGDATAEPRR